MRLSMWSSFLVEKSAWEMVPIFAEHGWTELELSDEHAHDLLDAPDPARCGAAFRRYAEEHGIRFPQGHFYLTTRGIRRHHQGERRAADIAPAGAAEFAAAMDDMKRWIELFQALGVENGVLHIGGRELHRQGWNEERMFERRLESLSRVLDFARGGPTRICLENLPGKHRGMQSVADFSRYYQALGAKSNELGLCLDTSHARVDGLDIPGFVREACAAGFLRATHISDNMGQHDDHMLPYGAGGIQWAEVMRALRDGGYSDLFNFEIPGENRCPLPVRLAKLDYARQVGRWMLEEAGAEPEA